MFTCPSCGLVNLENAPICECGFDFAHGDAQASRKRSHRRGRIYQILGAPLLVLGLFNYSPIPVGFRVEFDLMGFRFDLGMVLAGALLLFRGWRLTNKR